MFRSKLIAPALLAAGLGLASMGASGCTVGVRGGAYVEGPSLAYIGPGLYVVTNYDQPVFYSDGAYWLYSDGLWYRSGYYSGGWVQAYRVPRVIARIDRPRVYVRYHARHTYRPRQVQQRDHRTRHEYVQVRDHRTQRSRDHRRRR